MCLLVFGMGPLDEFRLLAASAGLAAGSENLGPPPPSWAYRFASLCPALYMAKDTLRPS